MAGRSTGFAGPRPGYIGPTVLEKVQALGDLHTIRHRYTNTFEAVSACEPSGAVGHLPGVADLVTASTTNRAVVSASGAVEAGVDLRGTRVENGGLLIPRAKIYPIRVEIAVHDASRGVFWRDASLPIRAERQAETRFREAAATAGIRLAAEKEAAIRVREIVRSTGGKMTVRLSGDRV